MATATKSSGIYVRVDPKTKSEVNKVCSEIGLTPARAINMFLTKVAQEKRIPFTISAIPHVKYLDELSKDEIAAMANDSHKQIVKGDYITGEDFLKHLEGLE